MFNEEDSIIEYCEDGTVIRVYYDNTKGWRFSTNKCIDAFSSYWTSSKSFGEMFDKLFDEKMYDIIIRYKIPYIMMHMRGTPNTMNQLTNYDDLIKEVLFYFSQKIEKARSLGINDLILDPGFGFGKSFEHNLEMLAKFDRFLELGYPVLAGISRKSMLGKITGKEVDQRLSPSIAAAILAADRGAKIIRAHDVPDTVDALKLWEAVNA